MVADEPAVAPAQEAAVAAGVANSDGREQPPASTSSLLAQVLRCRSSPTLTEQRRRALTQTDVMAERHSHGPLNVGRLLLSAVAAVAYLRHFLPKLVSFGTKRWDELAAAGVVTTRPGGPYAEVSWAYALLVSFTYCTFVLLGVRRMEKKAPKKSLIFECMAVYNCTQCVLNLYCFCRLVVEARALDLCISGNPADTSPRGYELGSLIWLQYHCRQMELLGTFFMVFRKKFQRISLLHLYLRVLNLWGWYFACRCACGGDTFVPTLITSACQAAVYLYCSLSLLGFAEFSAFRQSCITQAQIVQYMLCFVHNIVSAARGHLPASLATLHMFVIANGLILYLDFQSSPVSSSTRATISQGRRVSFSFDSSGWLMVYHFGVALWMQQHIMPGITPEGAGSDEFPVGVGFSGSSGGALIACVLAAGQDVRAVFEFFLEQHAACLRNPLYMFPAVEKALRKFQYPGAYKNLCGRIRVLLTRVSTRPPFVTGEVVDQFPDNETALKTLCASCHVPFLAGVLPTRIGNRYYYDGLAWPSCVLVPWRGALNDQVIRISALSLPLSDIRPSFAPLWWLVLPPGISLLRGLFWCGYQDAALWFSTEPEPPSERCGCRMPNNGEELLHEGSELEKWRAARALLKAAPRPVGEQLPAIDPTSGEDVQILIRQYRAAAEQASRAASCAFAALAVVVAVALTLQPVIIPTIV